MIINDNRESKGKVMKTILTEISMVCRYGREILRGVYKYARPVKPWLFDSLLSRGGSRWLKDPNTVGLISSRRPREYKAIARKHHLAVVGVGRWAPTSEFAGLPYVDVDPMAAGEMAAEYFIERGFQHFAMFDWDKVGRPGIFPPSYRGKAFVSALQRRGLSCSVFDPRKRYPSCGKPVPGIISYDEQIRRWLGNLSRPLALFAANDSLAQWICGVCWAVGFHIPEEIAVLGMDDDDMFCSMAYPHLSSIQIPAEQVGYEAARLLDAIISGKKISNKPILLPPLGLVTRQSTDVLAIDDRYAIEAMRFIRENALRGIGVEDVAAQVGLSRRSLERRFKKLFGKSVFAEIRRFQIQHLKTLLINTDKTLEAMVYECGFRSLRRMNAAFRRALGMPPGTFRKQFRLQ